ncbi:uncharacterized protein HMPREF1541_06963 [Cyphellophora europaea CBS 101466]|uniref:Uncharacterized protein n=1 Tax=Cyphellophora europaea (strain CBS 101466) TaxID=1220924 RepID=W2RQZ4_CYPE1|nr:uncharacterized protein HMPREF1541_06963 [Cyphellophora europaea CBS 101466]ETN38921.1 hypothetical protein HMPREF1541_06963 [Cyphellophora europaea CBS 101466]
MSASKPPSPDSAAAAARVPESLFSRMVVGPVLFVSFLLSLLLVDRKTYSSILGPNHDAHGYYHSHQRKLARSEMDQAFQNRSRVIAGMCMISGIASAIVLWIISSGWYYLRGGQS